MTFLSADAFCFKAAVECGERTALIVRTALPRRDDEIGPKGRARCVKTVSAGHRPHARLRAKMFRRDLAPLHALLDFVGELGQLLDGPRAPKHHAGLRCQILKMVTSLTPYFTPSFMNEVPPFAYSAQIAS